MLRIARKYKYTVMCIEQPQHYGLGLSHTRPSVLVLYDVGFNVVLNARIHGIPTNLAEQIKVGHSLD